MLRFFDQVNGIGRSKPAVTGDHSSVFAGRLQIPFAVCERSICVSRMGGRENSILIKNSTKEDFSILWQWNWIGETVELLSTRTTEDESCVRNNISMSAESNCHYRKPAEGRTRLLVEAELTLRGLNLGARRWHYW